MVGSQHHSVVQVTLGDLCRTSAGDDVVSETNAQELVDADGKLRVATVRLPRD